MTQLSIQQCLSANQKISVPRQVVGVAQTFCEVWETVAGVISEMDVLLGFAELAVSAPTPYVRPHMLPPQAGELVLEGCRSAFS